MSSPTPGRQGGVAGTFASLQRAIEALLPVAPDRRRVFRGQTEHYVPLLPSGRRRSLKGEALWGHYSRRLVNDVYPMQAIASNHDSAALERERTLTGLWLAAIAQHYGPGSNYLDVTTDLATAVWFALHEPVLRRHEMTLGPPGPASDYDEVVLSEWVGFQRATKPGYLYVFDAPLWTSEGFPEPGVLVDLAEAPEPFSTSVRTRVQAACLLRSGEVEDMLRFAVTPDPIQIDSSISGVPGLERTVEDLFPTPETDPWYARFLSLPLVDTPADRLTARCVMGLPAPVTLYTMTDVDTDYVRDIKRRLRPVIPPRVGTLMRRHLAPLQPQLPSDYLNVIRVDTPQLSAFPHTLHDSWNQELLVGDIAESVPFRYPGGTMAERPVQLQHVLIEWSPLELISWQDIVAHQRSHLWIRAVVIRHSYPDFFFQLIMQDYPDQEAITPLPVNVRYDESSKRLRARFDGAEWQDLAELDIALPIFVALALLRELSPAVKAPARLWFMSRSQDELSEFVVPVSGATAFLHLERGRDDLPVFSVRDGRDEPYTEAKRAIGFLKLRTPLSTYAALPAAAIRLAVQQRRDLLAASAEPVVVEVR